jgi:hypothetical protein
VLKLRLEKEASLRKIVMMMMQITPTRTISGSEVWTIVCWSFRNGNKIVNIIGKSSFGFPLCHKTSLCRVLDYDKKNCHSGLGMYFGHSLISMTIGSILSTILCIISNLVCS